MLAQCDQWKREVAEGIKAMQEAGAAVAHLKEYFRSLVKSVDTLRAELAKIKPSDFEGTTPEEMAVAVELGNQSETSDSGY